MPITRIGIIEASSEMMSKPSEPTCGSRQLTQNALIWSSISAIRRGVNTRPISPRNMVCTGGSSNIITPLGMSNSELTSSRMSLRLLENVSQSAIAFSTSACREIAQNRYFSLW